VRQSDWYFSSLFHGVGSPAKVEQKKGRGRDTKEDTMEISPLLVLHHVASERMLTSAGLIR